MTATLEVSQKIRLLLSEFDWKKLAHFIRNIDAAKCDIELQDSINESRDRASLNRWINDGMVGKHNFFKLAEIQEYLSDELSEKEAVITKAFDLLSQYFPSINPLYTRKSSMHILRMKYENLLKDCNSESISDFEAVENMGDDYLPYYKERLLPDFLNVHVESLTNFLGESAQQSIVSKMFTINNPLNRQQHVYPAIDLLPDDLALELSDTLSFLDSNDPPEDYIAAVKKTKPVIFNAPTFALQSLSLQTGEMKCAVSDYFKNLYHCDKHFYNIVGGFPGLNSATLSDYVNSTNMEDWAQRLKNIVVDNDFSQGEYSLGSACLFIYNTEERGYQALLAKMAKKANGFNDTHVIPASMFQPVLNNPFDYDRELNFKDQVIREVAEEIFGYPERTNSHPNNYLTELYAHPEIADLEALFESKQAEFHVTGLCLDMFRLRPEILSTIIIHDASWAREHFPAYKQLGNWETTKDGLMAITLCDDQFYEICASSRTKPLCAPGIASFIKGYSKFKDVMEARAECKVS